MEWAFRSRAAVEVLLSAGLLGWCAKRSGLGPNVDLMPRTDVYAIAGVAALCWTSGMRERVAEGSRGNEPQLRGVRGGIVVVRRERSWPPCCGDVGGLENFKHGPGARDSASVGTIMG